VCGCPPQNNEIWCLPCSSCLSFAEVFWWLMHCEAGSHARATSRDPPNRANGSRSGKALCRTLCHWNCFFPYLQSVAFHILSPAECDRRQVKVPLMGRCRAFAQGRCQARTKPPRTG
jgi:hypothetical protein